MLVLMCVPVFLLVRVPSTRASSSTETDSIDMASVLSRPYYRYGLVGVVTLTKSVCPQRAVRPHRSFLMERNQNEHVRKPGNSTTTKSPLSRLQSGGHLLFA